MAHWIAGKSLDLLYKIVKRKPELDEALRKQAENFSIKSIRDLSFERFSFVISDCNISCFVNLKINEYEMRSFEINADLREVMNSLQKFKDVNARAYLSKIMNNPEEAVADSIKALQVLGLEKVVRFHEPQMLEVEIRNDTLEKVGYSEEKFHNLQWLLKRGQGDHITTSAGKYLTTLPIY